MPGSAGSPAASTTPSRRSSYKFAPPLIELEKYCDRQGWKVIKIYQDDGISGKSTDRPALQAMLKDASKGKFQVLAVWKIDRLARSTVDLLNILMTLKHHGVDFCSTTQAIDTTNSMGRMIMTFLGAIAEFERETIIERVNAGISRARDEGVILGRPRAGFDIGKALQMKAEGAGVRRIAKALGVSHGTIHNYLKSVHNTPSAKTA